MGVKRNTGCRDDRCPNIEICIFKSIRFGNVWFDLLQKQTPGAFFLTIPAFVEFSLGTNAGTTSIQAIFDLCRVFWDTMPRHNLRELSAAEDRCFLPGRRGKESL
jgi:hypothetical protein